MHIVERIVDLVERLAMGDKFVNLELAILIVLDKTWQLCSSLDTAKSAATP
jgi:hypothetical protein